MSVKVEGITKIYDEQRAVDEVSFHIQPGEVVGFLGPNGAGKSTTMKILTSFIPPTSGKASIYGHDVVEESMAVRKRTGYLPEHNPLYLDMYVYEFLGFVAGIHRLQNRKARIEEMVSLTGLRSESKKKIGQLSKGYRQRVGLAQAMIHDPDVLILDEPTAGLDPNQLSEIRGLIKELGEEKTIILSTHILQEVQAICDRVLIIHKGKLVADDSITQLQARMEGEAVVEVTFKNEMDKEKLAQVEGVKKVIENEDGSFKLIADQGADVREHLFSMAVESGNPITDLSKSKRNLEDVFRQLTK